MGKEGWVREVDMRVGTKRWGRSAPECVGVFQKVWECTGVSWSVLE